MKRTFNIGKIQFNLVMFEKGWVQGMSDLSVNIFIVIAMITGLSALKGDFLVLVNYLFYSFVFMIFMVCLLWFQEKQKSKKK